MRLCMFLSLLLSTAAIVSTLAVAKFIGTQHAREDQQDQVSLQTTISSRFLGIRSTSQQLDANGKSLSYYHKSDSIPHRKHDHEKLIALCEAGFVTGCRQAIAAEGTAATSAEKAQQWQLQTFLESALALLPRYSHHEGEKEVFNWDLFTFSFIVIYVAAVCIAIASVCWNRWKCTLTVRDEKWFRDA